MKNIENFIKIVPKYRVKKEDKTPQKRNNKRKTTEQYKQELKDKNILLDVLEEYINTDTNIMHKCMICNNIWSPRPSNILSGGGCPICKRKEISINNMLSHEQFLEKVIPLLNESIEIIGIYKGQRQKIDCLCKLCNQIVKIKPLHLYQGAGHKKCSMKTMPQYKSLPLDNILEIIKNSPCNIEYYNNYVNAHTPFNVHCLDCDNIYHAYIYNIKNGHGCPKCQSINTGNRCRKSKEQFVNELKKINPFIDVLGDYINSNTHIECRCILCDNVWSAKPANLLKNKGCPQCKREPKGEIIIKNCLIKNNIVFISQKTFDNLLGIGNGLLSYDFYLPQYNLLIEFQGEQHEHPVEYFGGEEKFKIQQEHDKRKREYAEKNNINLLEIWYYDMDNIESILLQTINEIKENNLKLESVETVIPA